MLSGEAANTHFIVFDSIWAWSHNTRGKHTYHYTTDVYLFWGDLSLIPQHSRQAHLPLHHWCLFALRRSELDPTTLEASTLTITPLMFICFEEIWAWSRNTRGKHTYHYTTDVYLFWGDLSLIPQHSRQAHLPLHHWCLFVLKRSFPTILYI
jgi:hypothetical protein